MLEERHSATTSLKVNMAIRMIAEKQCLIFLSLIVRNAEVREVLSNSTSSAIFTSGLRLQEYTQVQKKDLLIMYLTLAMYLCLDKA